MKKTFVLSLIFVFLFIASALAETKIKAEVDKAKLSTDEGLIYKLTITSAAGNISRPTLPEFRDFFILSQEQSSSISFVQGGAKSILVYTYILAPQNAGKLKIEPSKITIEGKAYSSEEFEIEVIPGKAKPKPKTPPIKPPAEPSEIPPESEEGQVTL